MYTKQHGNLIKNTPILGSPTEFITQTNLWKRLSDVLGRAWLRPNRVVEFGIEGTWKNAKKIDILHVVDRSVALLEEPWLKNFEKYRKCWDFDDFWWFFTNSGMARSGCGFKIWTYILFGSISTRSIQILKNLGWSGGRLSQKLKNSGRGSGACAAWGPLFAWRSAVAEHKPKVRSKAMPEACEYVRNSLFLVPSIDYATTMKPTSKSWWNRKIWTFKLV